MKDELFNELVASVREGGKILRGKTKPARKFVVETPNIIRMIMVRDLFFIFILFYLKHGYT